MFILNFHFKIKEIFLTYFNIILYTVLVVKLAEGNSMESLKQKGCVCMKNSASVIMQDFNLSDSFLKSTHISIFNKSDAGWSVEKEVPVKICFTDEPSAVRDQLRELIEALGECRILAGKEISGLVFNIFDRMGFHIFNIDEINDACLDGILSDIEAGSEQDRIRKEMLENARPAETATPGTYFLDLIALQENCPDVSSKKALKTFFEEIPFLELELVCSHLPPWLENMGYEIKTQKLSENKLKATVINRFCKK